MSGTDRKRTGDMGEQVVADALSQLGWYVRNLNVDRTNFPNCDLEIEKGAKRLYIEVKTCCQYKWISAGGVNPTVCSGGPIFNKKERLPQADFVLCLTPKKETPKSSTPDGWRFFILPVEIAQREFRKNIDAYFNGTKSDGTPRSKNGACQDFVGPGECTSNQVPDHKEDYMLYEGRFDLLDG